MNFRADLTGRTICGLMLVLGVSAVEGELKADSDVFRNGVVASDHHLASQAGLEILQQGGNVIDAAAATSFALSVVRPASSGIGGGGFLLFWNAETQTMVALDYRERAPLQARRTLYTDFAETRQQREELSRRGHLAVAVPGNVAGWAFAVERYGSLDLKTVLQPAIRLAREGIPLDEHDRELQRSLLRQFEQHPEYRQTYRVLYREYLNSGRPWRADDRFHSPQLKVLELIAEKGPDVFYRGEVAEALEAEMKRGKGLITRDDLAAMRPVVRTPLSKTFGEETVYSMPPPSSGGVALLQILNLVAAYEQEHPERRLERLQHNSADYVHLLTEAMKHAFADRAEFLGDTDFVDVPVRRLISREYAAELASRIDFDATRPPREYGRFWSVSDGGTSHFSIIDRQGNAVACTETINTAFGSWVVEPRYGIVLNNEMDDFATVPGEPNVFGLVQSEANAVAPWKKPLSSMSPTIVVRDGTARFALGASGGPKIISATLQVLLNLSRFERTPAEAVAEPRFHHQWMPNSLLLERALYERHKDPLQKRDHSTQTQRSSGAAQAVSRTARGLEGGSDPRKHGRPAGY